VAAYRHYGGVLQHCTSSGLFLCSLLGLAPLFPYNRRSILPKGTFRLPSPLDGCISPPLPPMGAFSGTAYLQAFSSVGCSAVRPRSSVLLQQGIETPEVDVVSPFSIWWLHIATFTPYGGVLWHCISTGFFVCSLCGLAPLFPYKRESNLSKEILCLSSQLGGCISPPLPLTGAFSGTTHLQAFISVACSTSLPRSPTTGDRFSRRGPFLPPFFIRWLHITTFPPTGAFSGTAYLQAFSSVAGSASFLCSSTTGDRTSRRRPFVFLLR
jgi:hypothetical protein